MKKTYIAPKFTVVELETESIIAMSDLGRAYNPDDVSFEGESRSTLWGED